MTAAGKIKIEIPLNRVEGDLEIKVQIDNNVVTDAFSAGVMYRGFENMLKGRGALDGLVVTPRVCGICGTAHLTAASKALDQISGVVIPFNATLVRNLALGAEHIQSDLRHGFLMYIPDLLNHAYKDCSLYDDAQKRYAPLKGETVTDVIHYTKMMIEIIAVLGGQWPHSSYMVPGGVTTNLALNDVMQIRYLFDRVVSWYEKRILGCTMERWLEIKNQTDLDIWLNENDTQYNSDIGFFIRFSREIGLDRMGQSHDNFICFGQLDIHEDSMVRGYNRVKGYNNNGKLLIPAGFARKIQSKSFDHENITEEIGYSWYKGDEKGRHPFEGETIPRVADSNNRKYSWIKAPRYQGLPAETGPFAEMVISGNPLFCDFVEKGGATAFSRELARLVRPVMLMPAMKQWIDEINVKNNFYSKVLKIPNGSGFGSTEASRGALGHWVTIKDEKIEHYQIITPTAWNGSPRDLQGIRGPWEEALVGTQVKDPDNPVELGHVIRSFDPCLVCSVH
ncbi:MAG: nickel-dependent hydrogenase large subunit [Desulfobacteraceae bacterium]|nr:nickel-dependent hydrogenase large subunit [Desulfobacteraceae bacterium]